MSEDVASVAIAITQPHNDETMGEHLPRVPLSIWLMVRKGEAQV